MTPRGVIVGNIAVQNVGEDQGGRPISDDDGVDMTREGRTSH